MHPVSDATVHRGFPPQPSFLAPTGQGAGHLPCAPPLWVTLWITLEQDPEDPEQGWILISFMGTPQRFDQEAVDAFLASVE